MMRIDELPAHVQQAFSDIPNCSDIVLLFKLSLFGPTVSVRPEGFGQLANDHAATMQAIYHIMNERRYWWATYVGWQEVGGSRSGNAPADFKEQLERERKLFK